MISSGLIIAISALLLAYWFRYTCLLILCTKTSRNHAAAVAVKHKLAYETVRDKLSEGRNGLDPLAKAIEHDYQVVKRLLARADGLAEPWPMEEFLLRLNFAAQRMVYWATRRVWTQGAHAALKEMADVVEHLANSCGARGDERRRTA